MPTRRFLLGSSAAAISLFAASPALARKRQARKAPVSVKEAVPDPELATPAETPVGPVNVNARWACVMDFETGATLMSKSANAHMPPSSLTKMMTAYIVFGMLKSGRLTLSQNLPVSEKAWRMQGSKMFVPLGETVEVGKLVQGMLIQSGNDACIVLAEGIAASEEQFVTLMNQMASRMKMENTHFTNCTGWPDPDHYMSARDTTILAMHLIRDHPEYYHFFSEKEFAFNHIKQGNRNTLVDKGLADGLKTGHTDAGGFGMCVSSDRHGRRVVVTLNGMTSMNVRAQETARILDWAFAEFENVTVFSKGDVVDHAPVWMGVEDNLPLVAPTDIRLTLPRNWRAHDHLSITYASPLIAPISAGQSCGALVFSAPGMKEIRLPLLADHAVARLGLLGRASRRLGLANGTTQ